MNDPQTSTRRQWLAATAASPAGLATVAGCSRDESTAVELEIEFRDHRFYEAELGAREVIVVGSVLTEDGEPVTEGRVEVTDGTASIASPVATDVGTGTDAFGIWRDLEANQVGLAFSGEPEDDHYVALPADRAEGTLTVGISSPNEDYVDEVANSELVVLERQAPH